MIRKDQAEDMARGFGLNHRLNTRYAITDDVPLNLREEMRQMQREVFGKEIIRTVPLDVHEHRDKGCDHFVDSLYVFNRETLTAFVEQVAAKVEEQVIRRLVKEE